MTLIPTRVYFLLLEPDFIHINAGFVPVCGDNRVVTGKNFGQDQEAMKERKTFRIHGNVWYARCYDAKQVVVVVDKLKEIESRGKTRSKI